MNFIYELFKGMRKITPWISPGRMKEQMVHVASYPQSGRRNPNKPAYMTAT